MVEIIIPSAAILYIRPGPSEQHSNFVNISYYYMAVIQVQKSCTNRKIKCFLFLFFFYVFMYNRFNASKERRAINQSWP